MGFSKNILIILSIFTALEFSYAESPDIAILLKGMYNPYWKTVYDGVQDQAKETDVEVHVQGIQSDSDPEAQLNMCNTMLLRKPKALVFAPVNKINLLPCLRKASSQGIQLVDIDGGIRAEHVEELKIDVLFSVASDNYELGKKAAQYLSGESGKVLLIEGVPESTNSRLRIQGFQENVSTEMKVVASLPAYWDRLKAADITNDTITKHPDLKAVFAANDLMALGAAETLHARGHKNILVIGIDGIADAVKAIRNGRLKASIAQLPYLIGRQAVEKTAKLLTGTTYEFDQKVPVVALDQEVLNKNNDPLLQYVR